MLPGEIGSPCKKVFQFLFSDPDRDRLSLTIATFWAAVKSRAETVILEYDTDI